MQRAQGSKYWCYNAPLRNFAASRVGNYRKRECDCLLRCAAVSCGGSSSPCGHILLHHWSPPSCARPVLVQARTMKRARDIREQLAGLMERVEITLDTCGDDDVPLRKAITSGFFYNVGQLSKPTEGLYKTVKQRRDVYIHPGSGALTRAVVLVGFRESGAAAVRTFDCAGLECREHACAFDQRRERSCAFTGSGVNAAWCTAHGFVSA